MGAPTQFTLPLHPGVLVLSDEERKAGSWSRASIQRAAELMHRDGLMVISGAVDTKELDLLRDSMLKTAGEIKSQKSDISEFNHGVRSNFLQSPPLADKSLLFPGVYQNKWVIQAVEAYLGKGLRLPFITANTALANTTDFQPVHKDASYTHPSAPAIVVTNFLLSDFKPENGSTEFWLGSQATTLTADQYWPSADAVAPTCNIRKELLESRRLVRPPVQVEVPFGSVLVRDPRTWHRGMPNPSDEDRIMIGVAYQCSWFPTHCRFKAPLAAKELLEINPDVEVLCDYLPDDEWLEISQQWGVGQPMQLRYRPDFEGWVTLNDMLPEEKIIAPANVKAVEG